MLATKFPGMPEAAGVGDHFDLLGQVPRISGNAFGLVLDHQTALQARHMGGDTGRAGILVAAQAWMQPSENM